jgi:hypothetical protein
MTFLEHISIFGNAGFRNLAFIFRTIRTTQRDAEI